MAQVPRYARTHKHPAEITFLCPRPLGSCCRTLLQGSLCSLVRMHTKTHACCVTFLHHTPPLSAVIRLGISTFLAGGHRGVGPHSSASSKQVQKDQQLQSSEITDSSAGEKSA